MSWELLVAVGLLSWLVVALLVATVVGRGIGFGTRRDSDAD
jgi:hypothetical protein